IVAGAVCETRTLVNMPAADLTPANFADRATAYGKSEKLAVRVWDEKELEKEGFGGILGVGRGSENPPRLVRIEYKARGAQKTLALVGKGSPSILAASPSSLPSPWRR